MAFIELFLMALACVPAIFAAGVMMGIIRWDDVEVDQANRDIKEDFDRYRL